MRTFYVKTKDGKAYEFTPECVVAITLVNDTTGERYSTINMTYDQLDKAIREGVYKSADEEAKIENKDPTDDLNRLDPTKSYFTYPPVYCKGCPHALQPPNACPYVLKVMADRKYNCPHHLNTDNKDPWKHRSCGMKCRTCMWFVLKELTKFQGTDIDDEGQIARKNGLGRCRRHAPTMNGYPVCYEDDWCGDHKVDENKVQP